MPQHRGMSLLINKLPPFARLPEETPGFMARLSPKWIHIDSYIRSEDVRGGNLGLRAIIECMHPPVHQSPISFLVACYATLHPALLVRRSVGRSPFYFFVR